MDIGIKTEKKKAFFQYCCVCGIFAFLGATVSSFLSNGALLELGEQIRTHFSVQISDISRLYDFALSIIQYSVVDIVCVAVAFLFTFSVFNYLACDTVLAYQGFSTGLSCAVLIRYTSLFNSIAYFNTVWFIIFKVLMLVFFIVYLNLLTRHSFELKAYSANLRARIDPKTLLYLMIIMIFGCGTAILLNSVYCIGIITI